jgi:integrase
MIGKPRAVFLPPVLMAQLANHPRGLDRGTQRVFRFHQGGSLRYLLLSGCMIACGLPKPKRVKKAKTPVKEKFELDFVNFHTFCHTYGTWMRRYGKRDRAWSAPAAGRASSRRHATRMSCPARMPRWAVLLPVKAAK